MNERDELEERIESEGIDPKRTSKLTDVVQYGNVLATLWHQPASPRGITSYILRLDHSGDFRPDGSPLEAEDLSAVRDGLLWALDNLQFLFDVSQLFGESADGQ